MTTQLLQLLASYLMITGLLWKVLGYVDKVASKEVKEDAALWLLTVELNIWAAKCSSICVEIFEAIYTNKYFSWKSFWRSVLSSYLAVVIIYLILQTPPDFTYILVKMGVDTTPLIYTIISIFIMLWATILFNIIPDYISIIETRFIIKKYMLYNIFIKLLILILDLIITLYIFIINLFIVAVLFDAFDIDEYYMLFEIFKRPDKVISVVYGATVIDNALVTPAVAFICSTFLTSVFLWLQFFAGLLAMIINNLEPWTNKVINYWLNVEEKPFQSLSVLLVITVTIIYSIAIPFAFFQV